METVIDRRMADTLARHFQAITKHVPLRPVRTEAACDAAVASLNALLDAGAANEAHPLADLAATLGEPGSQGVVSELLRGKRELNLRQMRALASRFAVPVAAFVDTPSA